MTRRSFLYNPALLLSKGVSENWRSNRQRGVKRRAVRMRWAFSDTP